jgi:hypothetical protein
MSGSIQALRRANPRTKDGFTESVEATAEALSTRLAATAESIPVETGAAGRDPGRSARGGASVAPPWSARWSRRRSPWPCS